MRERDSERIEIPSVAVVVVVAVELVVVAIGVEVAAAVTLVVMGFTTEFAIKLLDVVAVEFDGESKTALLLLLLG